MNSKLIVTILLMMMAKLSVGQFKVPRQKDALKVKDRTLLVRLDYVSEEQFKKWYKKDQKRIDDHKQSINAFNVIVTDVVQKYWTSNKDIKFMKQDDIDPLMKKNEDKYAVFKRHTAKRIVHGGNHDDEYEVVEYGLFLGDDDKPIFAVAFADDHTSMVDMRFVVRQVNKYMEAGCKDLSEKDTAVFSAPKNIEILKSKTLLLPKDALKAEEADIKEEYPFPYKVITGDEIEQAVKTGDNTVVFPSFIWSERKNMYMFILIDAATLDVVSIAGMGGVFVNIDGGNPTSPNPYFAAHEAQEPLFSMHTGIGIGKGQLKYWGKEGAMKFNY